MKRLAGSVTFALVALVMLVAPVSAGREWCAKDPIVTLNGSVAQILVAVPEEYVPAVNGPIDVRVTLPRAVVAEVTFLDSGFNGHGETVAFQPTGASVATDGSFVAGIRASVPVDQQVLRDLSLPGGTVPVQVTVITNGKTTVVEGHNNGTTVDVTVQGSN